MNFLTPHFFYERIALDELYNICLNASFCLEPSTYLVHKTKNTNFEPIRVALFSEQCRMILVYSGSSLVDLQESYAMSRGISYTHNVTPLLITQNRPKVGSKNFSQIRNQHVLKPLESHKRTIG